MSFSTGTVHETDLLRPLEASHLLRILHEQREITLSFANTRKKKTKFT